MNNLSQIIKRIYKLYALHVALLLPLMGITAVGLLVRSIPYLNLFDQLVITIVFTVDWFVILWLSRITTKTMFIIGLFLFALTFPLQYLKLYWYVESIANLCYIIFGTAIFFEILKGFSSKS